MQTILISFPIHASVLPGSPRHPSRGFGLTPSFACRPLSPPALLSTFYRLPHSPATIAELPKLSRNHWRVSSQWRMEWTGSFCGWNYGWRKSRARGQGSSHPGARPWLSPVAQCWPRHYVHCDHRDHPDLSPPGTGTLLLALGASRCPQFKMSLTTTL